MFPSVCAVGDFHELNVGDEVLVLQQSFEFGKRCPEYSVVIENLTGFLVDEFVCSKYACVDARVFDLLFSRERKDFVVNPERRGAVAWLDGLAGAKHVAVDCHSQLGCEFVEKGG